MEPRSDLRDKKADIAMVLADYIMNVERLRLRLWRGISGSRGKRYLVLYEEFLKEK